MDSFINRDPASEASVALEIIARACFGAARAHQIAGRPCQGRSGARKYCSKMPSLLTWFLNHFALCRFASESHAFMCFHMLLSNASIGHTRMAVVILGATHTIIRIYIYIYTYICKRVPFTPGGPYRPSVLTDF